MRITKYGLRLDENRHAILVKEISKPYDCDKFDSPQKIVGMLNSLFDLDIQAEEKVYAVGMSSNCKILGVFEISHGTVNSSFCNPREIFIRMFLCNACQAIIVHNHPSGDPTPSNTDVETYKRLQDAGNIVGIQIIDSIVIGENGNYCSLRVL